MPVVDLNADLGESFGNYSLGQDPVLIPLLNSAHLACGFHGSDPRVMDQTVRLCRDAGVQIGAHPGFPDLVGFGRRVMDVSAHEAERGRWWRWTAPSSSCTSTRCACTVTTPTRWTSSAACGSSSPAPASS